jgi:predicted glycogen debranching enzyme
MFRFEINPNDPACIQRALKTEWLLTNGLGGYAMGTILGANTRRYHGLLVAATKPPVGRIVALHSMIEQLVIPREDGTEEVIDLSTQQFVGPPPEGEPMLHPGGWQRLITFETDIPRRAQWAWQAGGCKVHRILEVTSDANEIRLAYRVESSGKQYLLRLRPMLLLRDFHSIHQGETVDFAIDQPDRTTTILRRGNIAVSLLALDSKWQSEPQWWNHFAYEQDRERGQDWIEDIWSPGVLEFASNENRAEWDIIVSAGDLAPQRALIHTFSEVGDIIHRPGDPHVYALVKASRAFVVQRSLPNRSATSVIAGYPWFGDWGRDTMISLPGLMLCTKRFDEALSCLLMFARNIKNGLIPNLFDDYGGPAHYNTVDAPLWFIHAVHELWKLQTGRAAAITPSPKGRGEFDELLTACRAIIAAYRKGTDFNIFMDTDGLISAGDEASQLTWMDAKRNGVCFTPRHGKPVEVNALWHNALMCAAEMTNDPRERDELTSLSRQAAASFQAKFWWHERQCLHDVLQPQPDGRLRPNQIFAVSLPFSPLSDSQQRAVVNIVGERLLTSYGLRTLDRDDPNYLRRYEGSLFDRDKAYHNGTVWPWLMGPYCEALLRVERFSNAAKQHARELLQPLLNELDVPSSGGGCVNQLAEVYDGDPPQRPGGCPAQAWSVAEVLRILKIIESV